MLLCQLCRGVTFKPCFPDLEITSSSVELKTYTGEPMEILSKVAVQVSYQQQAPKDLVLARSCLEGTGFTTSS